MNVKRCAQNPVIRVGDVAPSRPDFRVLGAFNAGVAQVRDEIILLLRVSEAPVSDRVDEVLVPRLNEAGTDVLIERYDKADPSYDFSDSRFVARDGRTAMLTSLSHLRVARSKDGVHFDIEPQPALFPEHALEAWGIEDPRVTQIGDMYYITYSSASARGVGVGLAETRDFRTFKRHGLMLAPENKDVMIFPEKINGKYYALHRPVPKSFGSPEMWIAESPDLIHWGNHRFLMGLSEQGWDSARMGGGAVPIRIDRGWLALYHGADSKHRYCMGAVLLDLKDPAKVIARSRVPVLEPETAYEVNGFFGGVVFSCGAILLDQTIRMYYGAADEVMAVVDIPLEDIYSTFF
ncbi:glycoside hydrolase family 130 protein [Paenibacillus macerans]|uniref:Glycosidase n=1 Tax=Paenibacillus macerans TaxID=44252 RepID=A0A6N8EZ15_PAEMA|nr:glycoside hydrolase family 130 protein [Paenibacillus macerans]MBS5911732.1 glycoside hydrolase family 130 protein [Paenibacillus macerans]MEC0138902.1 glycoside hydrolase family 130 protein [Paenibacillus macerans]MUG23622.1 glycosidase [Paenibacillus macerans]UMV45066.1 glycoside hydrolase family 130 protein [Paenibacillus macerans]GBK60198.1 glycosidase [Paenibacillus macerans]